MVILAGIKRSKTGQKDVHGESSRSGLPKEATTDEMIALHHDLILNGGQGKLVGCCIQQKALVRSHMNTFL